MRARIVSFNIRCGIADDGPDHWRHRQTLVAKLLKDLSPDILGLQEAYDFQMEFVAGVLPEHRAIGVGREDGLRAGEFTGIFVRKASFQVLDHGTFWLSELPDLPGSMSWQTACTRTCTWSLLQGEKGRLWVGNLHLDHESEEARFEGTKLVLSRLSQVEAPAILMGDFNAQPFDPPIRLLHAHPRFQDPFQGQDEGTWHAFTGWPESQRIDYIFLDRRLGLEDARVDRRHENGRYPSDHFPLLVEAVLPGP